jgi:hypothetical protein
MKSICRPPERVGWSDAEKISLTATVARAQGELAASKLRADAIASDNSPSLRPPLIAIRP